MKQFILLAVLVMMVSTLVGCETVRGLGQDIRNTGENLKDLVDRI